MSEKGGSDKLFTGMYKISLHKSLAQVFYVLFVFFFFSNSNSFSKIKFIFWSIKGKSLLTILHYALEFFVGKYPSGQLNHPPRNQLIFSVSK